MGRGGGDETAKRNTARERTRLVYLCERWSLERALQASPVLQASCTSCIPSRCCMQWRTHVTAPSPAAVVHSWCKGQVVMSETSRGLSKPHAKHAEGGGRKRSPSDMSHKNARPCPEGLLRLRPLVVRPDCPKHAV